MATPIGKEAATMSTQRTFKRRVRARMTKTGESYTSARAQLIRKSGDPAHPEADAAVGGTAAAGEDAPAAETFDPAILPTSDEAMRRASGRGYADWFAMLDAWGARGHSHTEMATWLVTERGAPNWWSQAITVGYERARGLRAIHQMVGGYAIGANRTIALEAEGLLRAVMDAGRRAGWLGDAPEPRRNAQGLGIRFDWSDPPSRVALFVAEKGPGKATISIQHEKLPDAAAGERLKVFWREQLALLKSQLERGAPEP